jgi:hypothetical protein
MALLLATQGIYLTPSCGKRYHVEKWTTGAFRSRLDTLKLLILAGKQWNLGGSDPRFDLN